MLELILLRMWSVTRMFFFWFIPVFSRFIFFGGCNIRQFLRTAVNQVYNRLLKKFYHWSI